MGGGGEVRLTLPVGAECGGVAVLEHVHVTLDLTSGTRRGEFAVRLLSPTGTLSQLLAPRPLDNAVSGTVRHLHFLKGLSYEIDFENVDAGLIQEFMEHAEPTPTFFN